MTLVDAATQTGLIWAAPCAKGGVQAMLQPIVQMEAFRYISAAVSSRTRFLCLPAPECNCLCLAATIRVAIDIVVAGCST